MPSTRTRQWTPMASHARQMESFLWAGRVGKIRSTARRMGGDIHILSPGAPSSVRQHTTQPMYLFLRLIPAPSARGIIDPPAHHRIYFPAHGVTAVTNAHGCSCGTCLHAQFLLSSLSLLCPGMTQVHTQLVSPQCYLYCTAVRKGLGKISSAECSSTF